MSSLTFNMKGLRDDVWVGHDVSTWTHMNRLGILHIILHKKCRTQSSFLLLEEEGQ